MTGYAIWLVTLAVALCAGIVDWRSRRIPNWLTVPGLALGIGLNTYVYGWHGLKLALEGSGLCLALLLPLVLLRAMGAGDWKLMAALGALLGPLVVILVLLFAILINGSMAIVQASFNRQVGQTVRNIWNLVCAAFTFGMRDVKELTIDNPNATTLPFGVAAALATVLVFVGIELRLHAVL